MFVDLERQSFHDVLPIETDKSMKAQHKFTSDGQVVDFLTMRKRDRARIYGKFQHGGNQEEVSDVR